jgi:hypothetical protein
MIARQTKAITERNAMGSLSCLTCKERMAYRRGNCNRCYVRYQQAIRDGKTTWTELEEKGLALRAKKRGVNWMFNQPAPKSDP